MIAGLKETCGFGYASKLQRMFNDIQLSIELNDKFKTYETQQSLRLGVPPSPSSPSSLIVTLFFLSPLV